jgi:hypothetical protein
VALCNGTTTKVPVAVTYNAGSKTAVLNPTDPLAPNTTYTSVVEGTRDGDHKAVKDRGGTPMATDYILHFYSLCFTC